MGSNRLMTVAIVVLAVLVGAGLYWSLRGTPPAPIAAPEPPASAPAPAPAAEAPGTAFPLPGAPPKEALQAPVQPPAEAMAAFERDVAGLADAATLSRFVDMPTLVRRLVATVDNLASDELPLRVRAVLPIGGAFTVKRDGDGFVMDPANAARYEPFVKALEGMDTRRAIDVYVRHYRLFQGEYRGQGSPERYFNDRTVAAIDHLLATPEVREPVRLVQPKVQYRFADPALESLSAGQKGLIRMGPQNAARVKAKLRTMRAEIVRQADAARANAR